MAFFFLLVDYVGMSSKKKMNINLNAEFLVIKYLLVIDMMQEFWFCGRIRYPINSLKETSVVLGFWDALSLRLEKNQSEIIFNG